MDNHSVRAHAEGVLEDSATSRTPFEQSRGSIDLFEVVGQKLATTARTCGGTQHAFAGETRQPVSTKNELQTNQYCHKTVQTECARLQSLPVLLLRVLVHCDCPS